MPAAYQSFAQNSSTLGGPCVVTKPTGTVNGDLLTAYQLNFNPGNTVTAPAGWTLKAGAANADAIYEKEASGEGANWTWQPAALSGVHIVVVRSNGHGAAKTVSWSIRTSINAASFVIPTQTVPAGSDYLLLQVIVSQGTGHTYTAPGGTTERFDGADANGLIAAGGDQVVGSGATGTRTWTPSSTVTSAGFMVAIAPAAVANAGRAFLGIL